MFGIDNLIMVYSSYDISIQNFKGICAAVGKLCFIQVGGGGGMTSYLFQVRFFAQFFIDNLIMVYFSYDIHIQNFKSICAAVGKLCSIQVGGGGHQEKVI